MGLTSVQQDGKERAHPELVGVVHVWSFWQVRRSGRDPGLSSTSWPRPSPGRTFVSRRKEQAWLPRLGDAVLCGNKGLLHHSAPHWVQMAQPFCPSKWQGFLALGVGGFSGNEPSHIVIFIQTTFSSKSVLILNNVDQNSFSSTFIQNYIHPDTEPSTPGPSTLKQKNLNSKPNPHHHHHHLSTFLATPCTETKTTLFVPCACFVLITKIEG